MPWNVRDETIDRRRFIQAIGATGAATSLAGCTGGDDDDAVRISLDPEYYDDDENVEAFKQALHDAGVSDDIDLEVVTSTVDQREDQYRQWLNAGRDKPDVLLMDVGWSIPFIERGQLLNLNDHLSNEAIDELENDFNGPSVDSSRGTDGDLYGVPNIMDVRGILYRKDIAEEVGYDPDGENWGTDPMSWAEWSQIIGDVSEQRDDLEYGLTLPFELSQTITCCIFNGIMSQWGGAYFGGRDNLFGPIGDRPVTVDEEPVLNALRMIRTLIHGHEDDHSLDGSEFAGGIVPEDVLGWRYTADMEAFLNGNAFAYTTGVPAFIGLAAMDNYMGEEAFENIGLIPHPYGIEESESEHEGLGGSVSPLAGYNFSINPNSEMIDESVEVLEASMTDEFQIFEFELTGSLPPKISVLESEEVQENPMYGQYMDTFEVAADNPIPRPVTPIYFQQSDIIAQEVHNVISQDKSPEEGMNDLKDQLEDIEEDNAE